MDASARFVHALAAAILGDGASARAEEARAALGEALAGRRSLVLEVQFTGFAEKGQLVGGVDPALLRAAGHLITLRVNRLGFTADARAADLEAFLHAASRTSAELGEGGILAAVAAAAPHGVYVSTSAGQGYRPAARPAAPAQEPSAQPAGSPPAQEPAAQEEETELAEFEILDPVQLLGAPPAPEPSAAGEGEGGREEPPDSDMYHFFRAAAAAEDSPDALPGLLAAAATVPRFDELADTAAKTALALVRADSHGPALVLLDALVREGERPDRTRFFRESAVQALRRAATPETLHRLLDRLARPGPDRERILRLFAFLGGDALLMLEAVLYRGGDAELRDAAFATLLGVPGTGEKLIAHAVQDPSPGRARTLLELARGHGDPELARRCAAEVAKHPDAAARAEAVRTLAQLGGRGALRALVDLLGDPERVVRREAVAGLGALGDAAAVPFRARVLADGGDEELQAAAAAALGRLGTSDALPPLLALVQKRSLLSLRRPTKARLAAVQAISRIPTPAAREALQSLASGRDDVAEEARRLLD